MGKQKSLGGEDDEFRVVQVGGWNEMWCRVGIPKMKWTAGCGSQKRAMGGGRVHRKHLLPHLHNEYCDLPPSVNVIMR